MSTIVTRAGKGSPLTNAEVDANFVNLNTDKVETLTSTDGTVVVTGTGASRDLSVPLNPDAVSGPASATDNALARFDGTTGKLIQNSTVLIDDNGNATNVNAVGFDITPTTLPTAQGTLYWDNANNAETLSLVMEGGNAIQQIGLEQYYRVRCSAAITEGQAVMFTGTIGASGGLTAAPASGLTKLTASYFMGIATESGATNDWIYITVFGLVRGINTTGGAESWVDGQILYYNPLVAGGLTKTEPAAPAAKIEAAVVVFSGAGNGSLFVRPVISVALDDLNDVESSAAATGDMLQYTAGGFWQHTLPSAITGIGSANILTTGRTIAITGDLAYTSPSFDGSANVTAAGTLATVNANVGSFTNASVTVNAKGLVTAASSGTAPVTSVTGTSPVVSSGGATPAISLTANYGDTLNPYATKPTLTFLAAPNGGGVPTFRVIAAADIPTLNQNTTGTAANVTGTVAIANGGTGATTRQNAMDALAGSTASGQYLRGNGTDVVMAAIVAADVPTLNQNTTGTAANVTGTVAVANGGTGATSLAANNVILGNNGSAVQVVAPGTSGNVLTSNGTTWTSAAAGGGSFTGARGQVFTSTGTFTVPTGVTAVKVTVVGGGGNGGAATGTYAGAGGGGAGGQAIKYITGLTPGGTITATVGGIAGTSSFGAYCSATGGATAANATASGGISAGGAGGSGTSGDLNISGGAGATGVYPTGGIGIGGSGGGSGGQSAYPGTAFNSACGGYMMSSSRTGAGFYGAGGQGCPGNGTVGGAATGYGNGGGGGGADSAVDKAGGAGTGGIIVVEW